MCRYEPLSPEEQLALVILAKENNREARARLVETSMRLVISIAKPYGYREDFEDIAQEGSIGLVQAIRRFDINRGVNFSTCAVWSIRGAILGYFKENDPDYYNRRLRKDIYGFMDEFESETGTLPSVKEIAEMMDETVERVDAILESKHLQHMHSLDDLVYDGGSKERHEKVPDTKPDPLTLIEQEELATNVRKALQELPAQERDVMQAWILDQQNPREIAERLGITVERCKLRRGKALRMLRKRMIGNSGLSDYIRAVRQRKLY